MAVPPAVPCAVCSAPLVRIGVDFGAGVRTLCSCDRCDRRWWLKDGEFVVLAGVLNEAGIDQPAAPPTL